MKRKALAAIMAVAMAVSMAGCGGSTSESKDSTQKTETADSTASTGGSVENKDKPLCWFNRQPSSSATGELDKDALNFNGNTYYVGFDANQGAELQGQMVLDYIKKNADTIDRNGDGVIGYVLAIGDIGHNDSIARTRGVRSALGTGVDADGGVDSTPAGTNVDGKAKVVQDATLDVDGKTYTIRELASQEMKNSAGATWDAATAGNAIGTWTASFGDQIDVVVSNNDGMGMSMFNAWAKDNKVPTFGYDANSDAVAAIGEGYGGTISQHADVQAYLTLRVLRNALDGVDINTGIGTADEAGNCLTEGEDYRYSEEERSYYALNIAVTADTFEDELKVSINTKNCQCVCQGGKDQHTGYNSGDLTDTTGKGYTTNYAGCDGIHIPSLSVSCTTGTNHTVAFQPGTEAIQDTCQHKCSHCYFKYRDTGYCCRFRVSAYRIQVFAKSCFVPDKPYNGNCCNSPQNDGREFSDLRNEGIRDGRINRTERYTLGRIGNQTEDDQHVRHGRDKRMHFESRHEESGNHGKCCRKDYTH